MGISPSEYLQVLHAAGIATTPPGFGDLAAPQSSCLASKLWLKFGSEFLQRSWKTDAILNEITAPGRFLSP